MSVQLESIDGTLYYPGVDADGEKMIVLCIYSAGDCATINWPHPNMDDLRDALYDDRETGLLNDDDVVLLPDGMKVEF